MTHILFYVLPSDQMMARLRLTCKLAEKAHQQGLHTYIHTPNHQVTELLDKLLWTYNDLSFLPHAIAPVEENESSRIWIGHDYEPVEHCDYLINLSNDRVDFFSRFERFAEILDQQAEVLNAGRKRYKFYKDRGYNLSYHTL